MMQAFGFTKMLGSHGKFDQGIETNYAIKKQGMGYMPLCFQEVLKSMAKLYRHAMD